MYIALLFLNVLSSRMHHNTTHTTRESWNYNKLETLHPGPMHRWPNSSGSASWKPRLTRIGRPGYGSEGSVGVVEKLSVCVPNFG